MVNIYDYLEDNAIEYILHEHEPVFTVEEARQLRKNIFGMHSKNLFLKDSKRGKYYLVTAPADKKVNLKELRKKLNAKKLQFGKADELQQLLGVTAGAVSPLGLINDEHKKVKYIIDESVWNAAIVNFHPNDNSRSLEFTCDSFQKLITSINPPLSIIALPESISL